MPDRPVPEESVEAVMRRRVAELFGHQYGTLHGWPKFQRDRPADAVRLRELAEDDVRAAAPALRKQEHQQALAEAKKELLARLEELLPPSSSIEYRLGWDEANGVMKLWFERQLHPGQSKGGGDDGE
jgi:hypothetical protein